ncbi:hypothetical protein Bpfe_028112 [Biomphalaria pfeifferi]|uniref:Uncharacterized protein n=1 Tax=Biomphalaria pfeifferi TaxID=112525 RepID=A0AAD8AVK4_BIOPF|nr:hypothetical protein Bpfe_028112 [Biomphalaria pfeifferi]
MEFCSTDCIKSLGDYDPDGKTHSAFPNYLQGRDPEPLILIYTPREYGAFIASLREANGQWGVHPSEKNALLE